MNVAAHRNTLPGNRTLTANTLRRSTAIALVWIAGSLASFAQPNQPPATPTVGSVMEGQLKIVEGELVPAAEAMPEEKYSFAPVGGEFTGVRTFALEMKHVATANFVFYSAILGQDPPPGVNVSGAANGPEDIQSKAQIVKYLKDSFALGHQALATLTTSNELTPVANAPIPSMNTRLALASFSLAHASDHYGQAAEYLRQNGIIPPASQGQQPANPPRK
ncbi:MAG TPA: DinB family protein [Acidobacteriaceae bacterium]|jgi:uncharacterized damage-inducible protein DinB|nr:DinB family protein [Acidobacteriaceae bacterium]